MFNKSIVNFGKILLKHVYIINIIKHVYIYNIRSNCESADYFVFLSFSLM